MIATKIIEENSLPEPNTGCWLWERGCTSAGYGVIRIDGQNHYAHRLIYQLLVGPIPDGKEIDHKCGLRGCINPAHLEAVTHHENVKRGGAKTRARRPFCGRGHSFEDENAYQRPNGQRVCRTCMSLRAQRYNEKRRSKTNV